MNRTPLGAPPVDFSSRQERAWVMLEREPGLGIFDVASFMGANWKVDQGPNGSLTTAQISVNLGIDPQALSVNIKPRDWEVHGLSDRRVNVWDQLLRGRRVRIQTKRQSPASDWIIFDGILTKVAPGWSGSTSSSRTATAFASDLFLAAANEPGQTILGQWRRSRAALMAQLGAMPDPDDPALQECVHVTALQTIFNPGGRPNCSPTPIDLNVIDDQTEPVYVFTDVGDPEAEYWTVARILRYIDFALLQKPIDPGTNLDVPRTSDPDHPEKMRRQGRWSAYGLDHANLDQLISAMVPLQAEFGSEFVDRNLLRVLPDVAIDHMNAIEAFSYVADRAGVMFSSRFVALAGGDTLGLLEWTVLGDHSGPGGDSYPTGGFNTGSASTGAGNPNTGDYSTRGLFLYVPSDVSDLPTSIYNANSRENATEGSIVMDESSVRRSVRVTGDADEFEGTWELRPGWLPDAWLDVDPNDSAAVSEAIERIRTAAFQQRYVLDKIEQPEVLEAYGAVLRRWVLNEHGGYRAADYKRASGPWSTEAIWDPYDFRAEGSVDMLDVRGANGWSVRRRSFRPTIARFFDPTAVSDPVELGMLVQISYDGGQTWYYHEYSTWNDPRECGIYFKANDLASIIDPTDRRENFVSQFIRGNLRVRITANIQGDDALQGYAGPQARSWVEIDSNEYISRRGQYARQLRSQANSNLALGAVLTPDRDDSNEANGLAQRLRDEFQARRVTGNVTIPYLLRDGLAPWPGYRLGDEIVGILTSESRTFMPLRGNASGTQPSPRVVGITYRYQDSPAERTTELTLEAFTNGDGSALRRYLPGDATQLTAPEAAASIGDNL